MSSSQYMPVSVSDASLEPPPRAAASAADVEGDVPERAPLTKRAVYSSHRVESRTPRLPGESDAAFKRRVSVAHFSALLHSLAWVLAAAAVFYFTDLWNVVRYDVRVNNTFLMLSFLSGGVLLSVIAYLALWVPLTAKRAVTDLGAHAPTAAPVGAIAGVATFTFLTIALWPIWGFVTVPMVIVLAFAACLGPNLIPF